MLYFKLFTLICFFCLVTYRTRGQVSNSSDIKTLTLDSLMKIDKEEMLFYDPSLTFQIADDLYKKGTEQNNREAILEGLYWQCKVYSQLKLFFELSDRARELEMKGHQFRDYKKELLGHRFSIFVIENMKDWDKAISEYKLLFQKAVEFDNTDIQMTALTNAGDHYLNYKSDTASAFHHFEKCLNIAKKNSLKAKPDLIGLAYLNYGYILKMMKFNTQAAPYFDTAHNYMLKIPSTNERNIYSSISANELGHIFFEKKEIEKAQYWYETSNHFSMSKEATDRLVDIYTQKQDYKKALDWSNKYRKWQDEQTNLLNTAFTEGLKKVNAINEKEKQLKQYQVLQKWYLISFILLFVAFTAMSIIYYLYKKNADLQRKILQNNLASEVKNKESIAIELKSKIQDTQNLALEINRRNTFVNDLRVQVERFADPLSKNTPSWVRELHSSINSYLQQDMRHITSSVDEVNHSFVEKLHTRFPNLTSGDIELCGWLRLNMTSKDIATMKGVESKSVDMSRYRLRQKLGLSREDDMILFLKNI